MWMERTPVRQGQRTRPGWLHGAGGDGWDRMAGSGSGSGSGRDCSSDSRLGRSKDTSGPQTAS